MRVSRDVDEGRALLQCVQKVVLVEVKTVSATLRDGRLALTAPKASESMGKVVPVETAA